MLRLVVSAALAALGSIVVLAPSAPARAATVNVTPDGLQAALDAAQDGDVLVLRAGVYSGNFTLGERSNLTIRGRGRVVLDGTGLGDSVLQVSGVSGLTIEGITFRNSEDDGIHIDDSSNVTLRRCRFDDCGDSGVEDRNTTGYTVDRCVFTRCSWGLATGYGGSSSGVSITQCKFVAMGSYAIDLWSDNGVIDRCSIANGDGRGILLRTEFTGNQVKRTKISRMGGYGIRADGDHALLDHNKIQKGRAEGIVLEDLGSHTAQFNVVTGHSGSGVFIDSDRNTLTRNRGTKNGASSEGYDLESIRPESANTYDRNVFRTTYFAPENL